MFPLKQARPGKVRIIGGKWRGRKLPVTDVAALRPTPDRVRETLFNWLQPIIDGTRCLDLFAGTGVLGLEALSRGADNVVLVEQDRLLAQQLQDSIDKLQADNAQLVIADAFQWLQSGQQPFDIVFLDPPFQQGLVEESCRRLMDSGAINSGSRIYIEAEPSLNLPDGLEVIRQGKAGKVKFILAAMV